MSNKKSFGIALKKARISKKLTQEAFSEVSSRTYISSVERGLKSITLEKLEEISSVLNIHPLTLMFLAYVNSNQNVSITELNNLINEQLIKINATY